MESRCRCSEMVKNMNYKIKEIENINAVKLSGHKTDVQVQVTIKLKSAIDVQNLQVKLVSNLSGFNQIDKRKIDKYKELWNFNKDVNNILKKYTGEIAPAINNPRDKRRTFANEFSEKEQQTILNWLTENKLLIVTDVLKGRG